MNCRDARVRLTWDEFPIHSVYCMNKNLKING